MSSRRHTGPVPSGNRTKSQVNWKALIVAALSATEQAIDGLPIPAAKICISLVLKVIKTVDVAADNEKVLRQLQTRYEDLMEFALSMSSDIPKAVRDEVNDLDVKLRRLAERWGPRLTKKPGKIGAVLKLFSASDDRDTLKEFVTETDQAINDFLLRFEVKSWVITYREIVKNRQLAILSSMDSAQYAAYNALRADRAKPCLLGTRQTVLSAIDKWALNPAPNQPPIFWLNGLAGIGKTTIAHTVATGVDEKHQLGGSFFFLRSDDQRKDARLVFPTLALQLSAIDPLVRTRLAEVLENDPTCANQSLATQFNKLILDPMSAISLSKPLVIVLDALDECQPSAFTANILQILIGNIEKIPFLRIFITSRPEAHIREALGIVEDKSVHQRLVLHENVEVQQEVEQDIRLYLKISLQEIWNRDQSGKWPSAADLETLVQQSGKLFIYAATAVRYIGGNRSLNVAHQLGNLLKLREEHSPSTNVEPYMHLDQLYLSILETAFTGINDTYYVTRFQHVVGSLVLMQKAVPVGALASFFGDYDVTDIKGTLYYLHSIFIVPEEPSQVIQTHHLSFPNFITNAQRCTNRDAYIDPQTQERYIFLRCLRTMERFYEPRTAQSKQRSRLRQGTRGPVASQLVGQLPSMDDGDSDGDDFYIGDVSMTPEVRYSNNHWCSHLVTIRMKGGATEGEQSVEDQWLADELKHFFTYYLAQWVDRRLERTLSTVGATKVKPAQDTFDIMHNAHRWVAANIAPQTSEGMKQILQSEAREAFLYLFPGAPGDYTLGGCLNEQANATEEAEAEVPLPFWDDDEIPWATGVVPNKHASEESRVDIPLPFWEAMLGDHTPRTDLNKRAPKGSKGAKLQKVENAEVRRVTGSRPKVVTCHASATKEAEAERPLPFWDNDEDLGATGNRPDVVIRPNRHASGESGADSPLPFWQGVTGVADNDTGRIHRNKRAPETSKVEEKNNAEVRRAKGSRPIVVHHADGKPGADVPLPIWQEIMDNHSTRTQPNKRAPRTSKAKEEDNVQVRGAKGNRPNVVVRPNKHNAGKGVFLPENPT